MEFLKAVLGDGFADFESKVNAYNETNKDKPIKLANLSTGEYVGKDKFTALETEANGYKTQLSGLNKSLDELKKSSKGNEELTTKLTDLQKKYDDDTKALQDTVKQTKFDSAIKVALVESKAKNPKAVKALLDLDKIKFENDALSGFDEQIAAIQKDNDYLFDSGKPLGKTGDHHQSDGIEMTDSFIAGARKGAGLKEEK